MGFIAISQSLTDTDQKVVLSGGSFARQMYVGSNWKSIRVGIRCNLTQTQGAPFIEDPKFFIGVCSGTASVMGDQAPTHAQGVLISIPNNITFSQSFSSNGEMYYSTQGSVVGKCITATPTTSASFWNGNVNLFSMVMPATGSSRGVIYVDLQKNLSSAATQMTCSAIYYPTSSASGFDVSSTTFYQQMMTGSASIPGQFVSRFNVNTNISETLSGSLDCVNVCWDKVFPSLEIYDLAVHKFV